MTRNLNQMSANLEKDYVVKVGVDFGASTVKASLFDKTGTLLDFKFSNRINSDIITGDGTLVTVGGESVKVGSIGGSSNSNNKKVTYQNMKHLVFKVAYEVKKLLKIKGSEITLDIVTCLPPTQYKTSKDQYKENILSCNGLQGEVEGEEFTLYINSVRCGAEGIVMLNSFNLTEKTDLMNILLLDVGSSTTDIILLESLDGVKWKIKNATTSYNAGSKMVEEITEGLNSNNTEATYNHKDIERTGKYQLNGEIHHIINDANSANNTVDALLRDIKQVANFIEYKPLLCGQGSKILSKNDTFKKASGGFIIADDTNLVYGNSRGCLKA